MPSGILEYHGNSAGKIATAEKDLPPERTRQVEARLAPRGKTAFSKTRRCSLDYREFVDEQVAQIRAAVGDGLAINALSGGVDSSVVTAIGHQALGGRLRTVFIDSALMREGEPERVVGTFADLGIPVDLVDARDDFLSALKGLTDPEEKRNAVTQTFYRTVFGRLVRETGAKFLLHGTILTDI